MGTTTMGGKARAMTKEALESNFHLPMAAVAKMFGVCPTYFKRVCRNHGIMRWPYRQLRSMQRKGGNKQESYSPCRDVEDSPGATSRATSSQRGSSEGLTDSSTNQYEQSSCRHQDSPCQDSSYDDDGESSGTVPSSPGSVDRSSEGLDGLKRQRSYEECDEEREYSAMHALAALAKACAEGGSKRARWEKEESYEEEAQSNDAEPCYHSFLTSLQLPLPALFHPEPMTTTARGAALQAAY